MGTDNEEVVVRYVQDGNRHEETRPSIASAMTLAVSLYTRQDTFPEGIYNTRGEQVVSAARIADVYEEEFNKA